jgi:hypothetical protein
MTFVCLGWGSLIWCQKALPVIGDWSPDGPALPVEFARESRDKRITLVICEEAPAVTTLWAALDVASLAEAKRVLADREGIEDRNIQYNIGFWSLDSQSNGPGADIVAAWSAGRNIDGVVWTALKPKFGATRGMPREDQVIAHLGSLEGVERTVAEEYIRLTPRQIVTPYRRAIEATLGWTPNGLV